MSDCMIFDGYKNKKGYGIVSWQGKTQSVHRVIYACHIGVDISEIKGSVLHSCDNPSCINPEHLREGTNYENVQDRVKRGRNGSTPGEAHHASKLTNDDVISIRAAYIAPRTQGLRFGNGRELAEKYGISKVMLSNIIRRIRWTHI